MDSLDKPGLLFNHLEDASIKRVRKKMVRFLLELMKGSDSPSEELNSTERLYSTLCSTTATKSVLSVVKNGRTGNFSSSDLSPAPCLGPRLKKTQIPYFKKKKI